MEWNEYSSGVGLAALTICGWQSENIPLCNLCCKSVVQLSLVLQRRLGSLCIISSLEQPR